MADSGSSHTSVTLCEVECVNGKQLQSARPSGCLAPSTGAAHAYDIKTSQHIQTRQHSGQAPESACQHASYQLSQVVFYG
jgi:hypothetical protein